MIKIAIRKVAPPVNGGPSAPRVTLTRECSSIWRICAVMSPVVSGLRNIASTNGERQFEPENWLPRKPGIKRPLHLVSH